MRHIPSVMLADRFVPFNKRV